MQTTVHNPFTPVQMNEVMFAIQTRRFALGDAAKAADAGRVATARYEDSAGALALAADRYEALADKLGAIWESGQGSFTRDDLEHALIAASVARRNKARAARAADRSQALVLGEVVDTITALLGDESLVHDEY
jgi:hypothetical protein